MKNLKILIVEDEIDLANLIKSSIKELFFKVVIAKDGLEAIKKFDSFKPDIIISDIMMPNLNGLEMSKKIKEKYSETPIVILSAHSHKEMLLEAINLGISKYFIKPFDIEEFIEYLKELSKKINKNKSIKLKDNFVFDFNNLSLYQNDILVNLTKRERQFLALLIENKNSYVTTFDIKKTLWKNEIVSDERLRTFIKRLRAKTSKELIENVSSQGYMVLF
ncbi:response regulator transcription factor [Aliarcobacter skirrowii]|uniref:response regulator transcription factor n=1 Tax=Aliarcobacter skirrowii TaxID=28200 RepID=UPI000D611F8A|nr:response regulator transcription factor [Aliarcobacter skirrowii]PWE21962.1 DNA-binding response regulator [Aliarcobacter skirrowii]PWE25288.1 DNA-binding response regulator [Aliarcobacter skirrowii]RJO56295.1 DNA-binding response regulator [Aliarcobacter skirrowii]RJO58250.1 DNA-binding response regulator [Aliarcobacter skirrowii]